VLSGCDDREDDPDIGGLRDDTFVLRTRTSRCPTDLPHSQHRVLDGSAVQPNRVVGGSGKVTAVKIAEGSREVNRA